MQKIIKNKKKVGVLGIVTSLVLVALGVVLIIVTINRFDTAVEDDQDKLLDNRLNAIDYNIDDIFLKCSTRTEALAESERFRNSVDDWLKGEEFGDERMRQIMDASAVSNLSSFEAMFIKGKGRYISSIEGMKYSLGEEINDNVYLCTDDFGNYYFAVGAQINKKMSCYSVLDMSGIVYEAIKRANADNDSVMALEPVSGTIVYQKGDEIHTCLDGEIENSDINQEEARQLIKSQETGEEYYETYDKKRKNREIATRIKAEPAEATQNGYFAIGVSAEFGAIKNLVRSTATSLLIEIGLIAIGVILMILVLIRSRREKLAADRELEVLREKTKQMEQLNEKTQELAHHQRLETIGTLTSSIAHEFNNLLTPIMGYSIMTLSQIDEKEPIYDDILEIYNSSIKAKEIISRLSELSRKHTEITFQPLAPDDLVNKVLRVAAPALPKNVDIYRNFNCSSRRINGNEIQLSQLLLNLIINAFQAMKLTGGEIVIETSSEDGFIIFKVRDNGPGISRENMEKIFDPFFTTKESGEGTGLGLAIALQAAEDHKGRIEVDSEIGEGTEFRVYVPEMGKVSEIEDAPKIEKAPEEEAPEIEKASEAEKAPEEEAPKVEEASEEDEAPKVEEATEMERANEE